MYSTMQTDESSNLMTIVDENRAWVYATFFGPGFPISRSILEKVIMEASSDNGEKQREGN